MNYILYMHSKITTIYEMISQYEVIYNDFCKYVESVLQIATFSLNAFT